MPDSTPAIAPAQPAGESQPDRATRYAARLDGHLATFTTDSARLRFLEAEQLKWIARYERFCERAEEGIEADFGECATDYVLTIAEIGKRKARCERLVTA